MTHGDSLALTIQATQRALEGRLREAQQPHRDPSRPRDNYAATDTFMAATSRHLGAVETVLLKPVRAAVPGGDETVHEYLHAARQLEHTLVLIKGRLYGEAYAVHLAWPTLWEDARTRLDEHNRVERTMVDQLLEHADQAELDALPRKLFDAETHGPTRPHPVLPHTGLLGLVTRRIWSVADRLWDTAEGRVIPEPVKPKHHTHDSLLGQYLVADPMFDPDATILEHRHRRRRRP